ncbi:MAG: hypothetical protein ACLSUW_01620 [Akkermansia sp.]
MGKATVRAGSFGGFNALQTLRQLVFNRREFAMPVVRISDKPAFVLRELCWMWALLHVSRVYQGADAPGFPLQD